MKHSNRSTRGVGSTEQSGEEKRIWTLPVPPSNRKAASIIHVSLGSSPGGAPRQWAQAIKVELGMPLDSIWRRLVMDGAMLGAKWTDYELELIGMLVDASPTNDYLWPVWLDSDSTGAASEVTQLWRQRVTCSTSPLYSEVLWHPDRGRLASIKGLEESHTKSDLLMAWAGLELLQEVVHQGRSVGSVRLNATQFRHRAVIAYREHEREFGERPNALVLAEKLLISKATLYNYMRDYSFSMRAIEQASQLP